MDKSSFGRKNNNRESGDRTPGGNSSYIFGDQYSSLDASRPSTASEGADLPVSAPPTPPPVSNKATVNILAIQNAKRMLVDALHDTSNMDQIVRALKTYLPLESVAVSQEGMEKFRTYEAPFALNTPTHKDADEPTVEGLMKLLKTGAKDQRGARGLAGIGKGFKLIAGDDSEIGFFEFQKALQWMHVVHLSAPDTLRLFQHFDTHSSGRVDYKEFLIALRGELSEKRKKVVDLAFKSVGRGLSGTVTVEDIMKQYDASQHPDVTAGTRTAASVFKEFLDTFDGGDQHGAVTSDEFLAYFTGVSASIDDDDQWEHVLRNTWHISDDTDAMSSTLEVGKSDVKVVSFQTLSLQDTPTPHAPTPEVPTPEAPECLVINTPPPSIRAESLPSTPVPSQVPSEVVAAGFQSPVPSQEPEWGTPRFSRTRGRGAGPSSIVFG
mmetsp:Transcript_4658/g.7917  ORF Transcript_4658/g.7917 Transcript_4658/m.7917 type:complete len:437 (-) Transcript_4658:275-1585(-)|eukprot:CAMPEP_0198226046 /NCGR_PEP_ID=MMETSP1445-20131203/103602_1 /TAXON_ID=36898 /ORGANISM="Pyramimonas sp., Strain CCMP2087" /LENGTH=436 /DNA_ID=CAMNT_0043905759 /DNA_START=193 /DNA_END=1503 /DNA_ORIENTATION=-